MQAIASIFGVTLVGAIYFALFIAWATSVATSILQQAWIMLAFDVVAFPVGIIHGLIIWASIIFFS